MRTGESRTTTSWTFLTFLPLGYPQVLLNVLTLNRNLSDSLARGRLHPDLQSNLLQVDSECRVETPFGWVQGQVEKGFPPRYPLC